LESNNKESWDQRIDNRFFANETVNIKWSKEERRDRRERRKGCFFQSTPYSFFEVEVEAPKRAGEELESTSEEWWEFQMVASSAIIRLEHETTLDSASKVRRTRVMTADASDLKSRAARDREPERTDKGVGEGGFGTRVILGIELKAMTGEEEEAERASAMEDCSGEIA
jgi:hypothetical protein